MFSLRPFWLWRCWPAELQPLGIYAENSAYDIELQTPIRQPRVFGFLITQEKFQVFGKLSYFSQSCYCCLSTQRILVWRFSGSRKRSSTLFDSWYMSCSAVRPFYNQCRSSWKLLWSEFSVHEKSVNFVELGCSAGTLVKTYQCIFRRQQLL